MTPLWPVTLQAGNITLRPIRYRDKKQWQRVRARNTGWLRPWDATLPPGAHDGSATFAAMVRSLRAGARAGTVLPFVVDVDGLFRGQVTVGGIHLGSLRSGHIGYWIDQKVAGRAIIPTAVAMVTDHCFDAGLHRLEINIRPENAASLRVVQKLGYRFEGTRLNYLHIDGQWCDHHSYALTAEERDGRVLDRLAHATPGVIPDQGQNRP